MKKENTQKLCLIFASRKRNDAERFVSDFRKIDYNDFTEQMLLECVDTEQVTAKTHQPERLSELHLVQKFLTV